VSGRVEPLKPGESTSEFAKGRGSSRCFDSAVSTVQIPFPAQG
jgi:hypothetical protein